MRCPVWSKLGCHAELGTHADVVQAMVPTGQEPSIVAQRASQGELMRTYA